MNVPIIQSEYSSTQSERQIYLDDLQNIVANSNSYFEGNCFYEDGSMNLSKQLYSRQLNLFWCGKQAITRICEIGFNAGHSAMLMLSGRDTTPLQFTIFDIGIHSYTQPCIAYIQSKFSHVNFEYIEGDSTITIPEWLNTNSQHMGSYDVIHIDGGSSEHCVSNDMRNTDKMLKVGGILIINNTYNPTTNSYVNLYISSGCYIEMPILETYLYQHRVIRKINNETPYFI